MARPIKDGVDYFPLDVTTDTKFRLIEAKYGVVGFGIIIKLLQSIYREHGYYYEWDDDTAIITAGENSSGQFPISPDDVKGIVDDAIKRDIFDADMFARFNILTSRGIQRRYLEFTKRRARVDFINDYLLLSDTEIKVYVNINWVYVNKNGGLCMQKSLNKSKVNKTKLNKSNISPAVVPQNLIDFYQENISRQYITPRELDNISFWVDKIDADVIMWAMEQAVDRSARNWSYIEKILQNHYNAGRTTLEAIQLANKSFKAKQNQPQSVYADSETDYDEIEKIVREKM